jgi:hypothetical protein
MHTSLTGGAQLTRPTDSRVTAAGISATTATTGYH